MAYDHDHGLECVNKFGVLTCTRSNVRELRAGPLTRPAEAKRLPRPPSRPTKEAAIAVRAVLAKKFKGIKFSVRSEHYSQGSSVNVSWTDGPTEKQVSDAAEWEAGVDRNLEAESMNRFLQTSRTHSAKLKAFAERKLASGAAAVDSWSDRDNQLHQIMYWTAVTPQGVFLYSPKARGEG